MRVRFVPRGRVCGGRRPTDDGPRAAVARLTAAISSDTAGRIALVRGGT
jgi:hypothetical protein